jgi:holo-[acyl-carrier protein] synthase
MIYGIGVDIVDISRCQHILNKFGDRFSQKILNLSEQKKFNNSANFLAKRFAAKEALSKAFGTGFRNGLTFQQIEIKNDNLGKPFFKFHGKAKSLYNEFKIKSVHLSLSDTNEQAIAFVILET